MESLPNTPFRVDFEVTSECNLNCSYCSAKPFNHSTPTYEELVYLFEKTKREAHPFDVLIEGGEPFVRPDVIDVLTKAREVFGEVAVVTNGTLLSRLSREELSELRQVAQGGSLQVSLDSTKFSVNDTVRGATRQVLDGLDILEEGRIPFSIGLVLTSPSIRVLRETLTFLLANYKELNEVSLLKLFPSLALGDMYFELAPSNSEIALVGEVISSIAKEFPKSGARLKLLKSHSDKNAMLAEQDCGLCTAGLLRAGVLYNGDVVPCTMIRTERIGNLFEQSWPEIWKESLRRRRVLESKKITGQQCDLNLKLGMHQMVTSNLNRVN
jgi:MoaA/NifB/PqqE/SkfB family radical SAM enzyme